MSNNALIKNINSRRVFDSRGNPSIEVEIFTIDNSFGRAISPSGASTGSYEAVEIRDNDEMFNGNDIKKGLETINLAIDLDNNLTYSYKVVTCFCS